MGGSTTKQDFTQTQQTTQPWAPAQPGLNAALGQLTGLLGNTAPTGAEQNALTTLESNAQAGNPYAGQIGTVATSLLGGGPDRSAIPTSAYDQYRSALDPTASGAMLDPSQNSALMNALSTIPNTVGSAVNQMFAGAGRDLSGANQQAVARGISEAEAPLLLNAYNSERQNQINAQNALYNAGNTTAGVLSGLDQQRFANQQAGINAANAAVAALDAGPNAVLAAEAARRALPVNAISPILNLLLQAGKLGQTSDTNTLSNSSSTQPLLQQITGATGTLADLGKSGVLGSLGSGLSGLGTSLGSGLGAIGSGIGTGLGAIGSGIGGGLSSALAFLPALFSDERVKENAAQVGELYDGTPVHSFNYIGDPAPAPRPDGAGGRAAPAGRRDRSERREGGRLRQGDGKFRRLAGEYRAGRRHLGNRAWAAGRCRYAPST
jgi:hypothetical protein